MNARHKSARRRKLSGAALSALTGAITAATAADCVDGLPLYYDVEITQQPCGGSFPAPTHGTGISGTSMVCGSWTDCATANDHAFIWPTAWPATLQTIPYPPGVNDMQANDISDQDWIVGQMSYVDFTARAFLRKDDGTVLDLGVPPGGDTSKAHAVSSTGTVVGEWNGAHLGAFRWAESVMTDLTAILGMPKGIAYDISEDGALITGWGGALISSAQAFILDGDRVTFLPLPPGAVSSQGLAINIHGDVCGRFTTTNVHAYAYLNGKSMVLPELIPSGSRANDLNDDQLIVGYSGSMKGTRGVIWTPDGQVHDLNDLIDPPFFLEFRQAHAINAPGVITGEGIAQSGTVAVRLTPVWPLAGDLNCDGIVNGFDLAMLLGQWGSCRISACAADLSDDGIVNGIDLAMLLSQWG